MPASVGGDERLRLFCALRLPATALDAVVDWQRLHVPSGRVVPRENLHVTLAFLGTRPSRDLGAVAAALRAAAAAARPIRLEVDRYRETRSVGMLVLADADGAAAALALDLQARLERAGLCRAERRAWTAHLTVVRFRERPRLRPPLPPVGTFVPSDAAAYLSRPGPGGARYEVLESVALGG